jgi:hypothetical protein
MDDLPIKPVECNSSLVFLRDDGILQINVKDNVYFEEKDVVDLINAAETIGGGKKFLNLIRVGKGVILDSKGRILSSSIEGCKYKLADAFVINSLAQQLIANFIIKFERPPVPTSFFKDEESAVKWLMSI